MASVGVGSVGHITGEMFAKRVGINMMHMPYKGAGPAASDLLRGITDFYFATPQASSLLSRAESCAPWP